jgi:hypothetical protein
MFRQHGLSPPKQGGGGAGFSLSQTFSSSEHSSKSSSSPRPAAPTKWVYLAGQVGGHYKLGVTDQAQGNFQMDCCKGPRLSRSCAITSVLCITSRCDLLIHLL